MEEVEEVVIADKRNQEKEDRVREAISSFLQEQGEARQEEEEEEKMSPFFQEVR